MYLIGSIGPVILNYIVSMTEKTGHNGHSQILSGKSAFSLTGLTAVSIMRALRLP